MNKRKILLSILMLLFGLQLTGCYWHHHDYDDYKGYRGYRGYRGDRYYDDYPGYRYHDGRHYRHWR